MGIHTQKTVFCDGENCDEWIYSQNLRMSDIVEEFRGYGWTFKHGKFYCPECSASMEGE